MKFKNDVEKYLVYSALVFSAPVYATTLILYLFGIISDTAQITGMMIAAMGFIVAGAYGAGKEDGRRENKSGILQKH